MSQSPLDGVVAHWHQLVGNFQASPTMFYASVEENLRRRQIPGLRVTRVEWNEGGVLSPRREYLRVHGEHHVYDLCAAPFGSGFFFSSWLKAQEATWVTLHYILFLLMTVLAYQGLFWAMEQSRHLGGGFGLGLLRWGFGNPLVLWPVSALAVLWIVGLMARAGNYAPERAMLTIPLVGWFYRVSFAPETFYRVDTMLMFQSAVLSAMHEAINGLLSQKGLRALTENERRPVYRELLFGGSAVPVPSDVRAPSESDTLGSQPREQVAEPTLVGAAE